jgi:hypothetical protein
LLAAADLRVTGFLPAGAYDPGHYLDDLALRDRAARLSQQDRWALAEDLSGALKTHVFYAVRRGDEHRGAAQGFAPAMVPVLLEMAPDRLAASLAQAPRLTAVLGGVERRFVLPDGAAAMVALIDGRRSLRQIHGRLRAAGAKLNWTGFQKEFSALYDVLHPLNMLLFAGAVLD